MTSLARPEDVYRDGAAGSATVGKNNTGFRPGGVPTGVDGCALTPRSATPTDDADAGGERSVRMLNGGRRHGQRDTGARGYARQQGT